MPLSLLRIRFNHYLPGEIDELEAAGRLTQPLKYDDVSDCYKPLSWQQAFDEIGARLQSYSDPNQVEFYTSGRTSNEAAFLYQLFAREYGSNNFPDCSNMCHEPTSVDWQRVSVWVKGPCCWKTLRNAI